MDKLKRCLNCNNKFERPYRSTNPKWGKWKITINNYKKRKFCSKKCRGEWFSKNILAEKSSNWRGGKSKCIDCNKELSERYNYPKRCKKCWYEFMKKENCPNWKGGFPKCKICGKETGDYKSKICRKCYRGKYHPLWNGGTSSLSALIRSLPEYKKWTTSVFQRDKYTCQKCKDNGLHKNNNLCPHHIKSFAIILKENNIKSLEQAVKCKELWNINNGITLCRKCHKETDSFAKKLL